MTHAINSQLFKKLIFVSNELYEVELDTTVIEHNEPIIVGVFVLQSANSQKMELYYNFSLIFVMQNKFKLLEVLCRLLLPRSNWKIVSNLKQKQSGSVCGRGIALIVSLLMQWQFFPPCLLWQAPKRSQKSLNSLNGSSEAQRWEKNEYFFHSKRLKERELEQSGDASSEKVDTS